MRFQLRRLRPGEVDHELIWLCVTFAAALGALLWLSLRLPFPRCTFRALTGWPCPTCGATRAALEFLHGGIAAAWRMNPLVTVGFASVALFDTYALAVLALRWPRVRFGSAPPAARKIVLAATVVVLLLNWIYLLRTR